jgi:preprotein translocase subunit SecE
MSLIEQASQFFREVKIETRKVTYPSKADTAQATKVVLGVVVVISVYLAIADYLLSWLMGLII